MHYLSRKHKSEKKTMSFYNYHFHKPIFIKISMFITRKMTLAHCTEWTEGGWAQHLAMWNTAFQCETLQFTPKNVGKDLCTWKVCWKLLGPKMYSAVCNKTQLSSFTLPLGANAQPRTSMRKTAHTHQNNPSEQLQR